MKVKNKRCIRNLSFKQLKAAKTRNFIAIFAIALTTMLFTSLFTIVMSLNASYEEYTFRQMGGYSHGTFKEVDDEKIEALSGHKRVKEYGLRTVCGFAMEAPFAKKGAEISWMDANATKWGYATPTTGRIPESGMEIAMDTEALKKLGVPAKLGEQVELTYTVDNRISEAQERTDVFTLVGFWEYDSLMPVHYINVSEEYVKQVEADSQKAGGSAFRTDMEVMLASSFNIRGVMESIDTDLGYQWEERGAENCVRIGTNWGYSTEELLANIDVTTVASMAAFLILIVFTGYLIIYNIFQISVSNDIRFYGLLKTIGTTPRQLKRIVRRQAMYLSIIGIPLGCMFGYGIGAVLTPKIASTSIIASVKISASPVIFIGSALFSLVTVWLSCARPGKKAAKITPVEAVRYTENAAGKKKKRATRGAKVGQMAFANLGRNRTKTVLVVLSLSLAVVLLNSVFLVTSGFDMEKYLNSFSAADFVVGTTDYFRSMGESENAAMPEKTIQEIEENTAASLKGSVSIVSGARPQCWISEAEFRRTNFLPEEIIQQQIDYVEKRGNLLCSNLLLEGMEESLLEKLVVYEGSLEPLSDPTQNAIALATYKDDDGNVYEIEKRPGDTLTVTYVDEVGFYDKSTGEPADETTPDGFIERRVVKSHDVTYTVCALVGVPYSLGFRFAAENGYNAILTTDALKRDWGSDVQKMIYLFDTPDEASEEAAEKFLADYTAGEDSGLNYESKAELRKDFENFRNMYLVVGTTLCIIVGLVGILNFFNAILTGILTRHREFAMLQSVGMTGRQLKQMLVLEGLFYTAGAGVVTIMLTCILNPLVAKVIGNTFWFFIYRFTILPVLAVLPVFVLLGVLLPLVIYKFTAKKTIVERLREME